MRTLFNTNFTTYFFGLGNTFIPTFNIYDWFTMPTFDFDTNNTPPNWVCQSTPMFDFSQNCVVGDSFKRCSTKTNGNVFAKYNKTLGEKLSSYTKSHATGFKHSCAEFVSNALEKTHLSNGQRGHGYEMKNILRKNSHFNEVAVADIKDLKSIPKGAILVYDKGACGYSKEYGHVEVSIGGGQAASDGIQNIKGKPSALFIPV